MTNTKTKDVLYIRDALSKTVTVDNGKITIKSENGYVAIVPDSEIDTITKLFEFSYNRADEFTENSKGVNMSISGGLYPKQVGDIAHNLYIKYKTH